MFSVGRSSLGFGLGTFRFDLDLYPIETRNEFAFKVAEGVTVNAGMDFQVAPFHVLAQM